MDSQFNYIYSMYKVLGYTPCRYIESENSKQLFISNGSGLRVLNVANLKSNINLNNILEDIVKIVCTKNEKLSFSLNEYFAKGQLDKAVNCLIEGSYNVEVDYLTKIGNSQVKRIHNSFNVKSFNYAKAKDYKYVNRVNGHGVSLKYIVDKQSNHSYELLLNDDHSKLKKQMKVTEIDFAGQKSRFDLIESNSMNLINSICKNIDKEYLKNTIIEKYKNKNIEINQSVLVKE